MEKIAQIMKAGKMNITFHSSQCEKHSISNMVINEKVICPRCEKEKADAELSKQISMEYAQAMAARKYNTLAHKSVIEDNTILKARFSNYKTYHQEEIKNHGQAVECFGRYSRGEKFNMILQGKPGTGKSHLAYSTLHELNELKRDLSCCFINVEAMMRKIKGSFNDKESKYTEDYFIRLLSEVDVLALDDLGAETGAINTDKKASDFVQRVLYAAANVRQDKATILTTNLDSKTLYSMYDAKLLSRLLRNPEYIIFKDSKDKRQIKLPF